MKVSVAWRWRSIGSVELDEDRKLRFPQLPAGPGIYRLELQGDLPLAYVGESQDLRRRAYSYRNPGATQQTNHRLNRQMTTHLEGGRIEFSLITEGTLEIDESTRPIDFSSKAERRLLESAAIAELSHREVSVANL